MNIDRDKVQLMGIPLNSVFTALGYYMGEAYVNDYVQFGHIYQVKLGAGDRAQRVIDDVLKLSVPNASGEWYLSLPSPGWKNSLAWTR